MGSFERFYSAEHDRVLAIMFAMAGDWSVAEDLTQEAFARAYRRWEDVSDYDRPDSWVRQVAVNLLRSRARRVQAEWRARARLRPPADVAEPTPLPYELERFWAAVRELPRQQAAAITLHLLEDRQPAEMAHILNCSPSTARVHLHRARKRLQTVLSDRHDAKDLA